MNNRTVLVFLVLFCAAASVCVAEMNLWLKDGRSISVYKVVFQGENADLYLMDGTVRKIPVDQIDLQSSGILKPQGTYGGTGPAPKRIPLRTPPTVVNPAERQKQLKEEWERAEKKAVALSDVGPIRRGDVVHIVSETSQETINEYEYEDGDYYYKPPRTGRRDEAYVILYQTPDGTYGKKLFDAATFARFFKLEQAPGSVATMPVEPRIPGSTSPQEKGPEVQPGEKEASTSEPAATTKESTPGPEPESSPAPQVERPSGSEADGEDTPVWPILLAVVILAAGTIVVMLLLRRKKGFIDNSKFSHYEEELKDFEIEIWLKHGKTMDQLVEVCVKKFYGDQPDPLSAITKIRKGVDKNSVVAFISKQGSMPPASAERIYVEMRERIDWIQKTIEDVARRTGKTPLPESAVSGAPTGIMPSMKTARPAPAPAVPASAQTTVPPQPATASAVPLPAPLQAPPPTGVMSVPGRGPAPKDIAAAPVIVPVPPQARATNGLPPYLQNVLNNLAFLSTEQEE